MNISVRHAKKKVSRILRNTLLISLVTIPIGIHYNIFFSNAPYDDNHEMKMYINAFFNVLNLIVLHILVVSTINYFRFKKYFLTKNYLLLWKYPSKEELILTEGGLVKYSPLPIEVTFESKIDKVTWGLSNVKNLVEGIEKEELSADILLPKIHYSTTTNKVDDIIIFSWLNSIDLIFFDLTELKILVINIENRFAKQKIMLRYPVPEGQRFNKDDFTILCNGINASRRTKNFYIDEQEYSRILNASKGGDSDN